MALLSAEKDLTRRRDELARQRRELPWERVEKDYVFEGPNGPRAARRSLRRPQPAHRLPLHARPQLGRGLQELLVPGRPLRRVRIHLPHRDVGLAAVSQAPMQRIQAFRQRMGWRFPWVSAFANRLPDRLRRALHSRENCRRGHYNYGRCVSASEEAPGLSVFYKDAAGQIFHTYSAYARGLEALVGTYQFLDLVPKGRDEDGLAFSMAWVRHHDSMVMITRSIPLPVISIPVSRRASAAVIVRVRPSETRVLRRPAILNNGSRRSFTTARRASVTGTEVPAVPCSVADRGVGV